MHNSLNHFRRSTRIRCHYRSRLLSSLSNSTLWCKRASRTHATRVSNRVLYRLRSPRKRTRHIALWLVSTRSVILKRQRFKRACRTELMPSLVGIRISELQLAADNYISCFQFLICNVISYTAISVRRTTRSSTVVITNSRCITCLDVRNRRRIIRNTIRVNRCPDIVHRTCYRALQALDVKSRLPVFDIIGYTTYINFTNVCHILTF